MNIAERTLQLKKDFDEVYKAGQSSMVDESKIIEKTVSGEYISVDDVSEIPHEVKVKLTSGNGKNLFNINSNEIIKGQRIAVKTGGVYPNSEYNVSHYIPVEGGKIYAITTSGFYIYYSFYDENYTYITGTGTSTIRIVTTPQNACYFRFDYPNTDTEVQFEQNDTITPYEPYKETLTDYSGVSLTRWGKNLWKSPALQTLHGVTLSKVNDYYVLNGTALNATNFEGNQFYLPSGTYTLSAKNPTNNGLAFQNIIQLYSADSGGIYVYDNENYASATVTIAESTKYRCRIRIEKGITYDNYIIKPQLELGSTETEYKFPNHQVIKANADGTVEGVKSTSPYMYMTTDNPNVTINATYHKSYGMQTEYDRFWDSYQDGGKRTNYSFGFGGRGWTDETFKPKYPNLPPFEGQTYMFQDARMSEIDIDLQFTLIANIDYMFAYNSNLKRVKSVTLHASATGGNSCFREATALEDVTFKNDIPCSFNFQWSTKLSKATILNIFEHLSSTVTGQTLTLSKTAVTNAFGSTTSTEWTSLVATKTNWTISLV